MGIAQGIVNVLLVLLLIATAVAVASIPAQIELTRHALEERANGLSRLRIFEQAQEAQCKDFKVWLCTENSAAMNNYSVIAACKVKADLWIKVVLGFLFRKDSPTPDFVLITAYPSNEKSLFKSLKKHGCTEADEELYKNVLKEFVK